MTWTFTLFLMLFCHIIDDYYLQGILAKMKQKIWWDKQTQNKLYKNDYIMALVMHSLSWAFMITLPLAIKFQFDCGLIYVVLVIGNAIIHGMVDELKANQFQINLVQDQCIHIGQIIVTWFLVMVVGYM